MTTRDNVREEVVRLEMQVHELWRLAATADYSERLVQASRALRVAARALQYGTLYDGVGTTDRFRGIVERNRRGVVAVDGRDDVGALERRGAV